MKFHSVLFLLLFSSLISTGQCVPDSSITHSDPGIYPDSITGLPQAITGIPYSTVLQVKVLTDTTVSPFHVFIDSIVIGNVSGLPIDFTYLCVPASCSFPGGSDACILLQGPAPTLQMVGTYPLIVHTVVYFKLAGTPQSQADNNDDYTIVIDTTTGISVYDKLNFSVGQCIPNPVKDYALIPVTLSRPNEVTLTIVNLIGKKVFNRSYNLPKGTTNISLDLHQLQPGIYLYTFSNGVNSIARRMIISNE